jgi:hypothetical protein
MLDAGNATSTGLGKWEVEADRKQMDVVTKEVLPVFLPMPGFSITHRRVERRDAAENQDRASKVGQSQRRHLCYLARQTALWNELERRRRIVWPQLASEKC